MAHPFKNHSQEKVSHDRAKQFTKAYATGGAVADDSDSDPGDKLVKGMLKSAGGKVARASGGRTSKSSKKNGKTHINIMVAPSGGAQNSGPPMMAHPPMPMPAAAAPPPPPMGGPPMPPGAPPPGGPQPSMGRPTPLMAGMSGMPTINAMPGRKKGGRVKENYMTVGTKVQGSPGKNDLDDIKGDVPAIARANGGAVGHKYPDISDGAGGGEARLEKIKAYGLK